MYVPFRFESIFLRLLITASFLFIGFYAAINVGWCGAISASFLARDQGYVVAFLESTLIFLVPLVLVIGKNNYVKTPPRGSILLETLRVKNLRSKA